MQAIDHNRCHQPLAGPSAAVAGLAPPSVAAGHRLPLPLLSVFFNTFEKWFTWDPVHEDRIRMNFENRGNVRLRDFFGKARKHNKKPVWLGDPQWDGFQQYWANEHYKKLRETAQKNRLGTPESGDPYLHTCGSIHMH